MLREWERARTHSSGSHSSGSKPFLIRTSFVTSKARRSVGVAASSEWEVARLELELESLAVSRRDLNSFDDALMSLATGRGESDCATVEADAAASKNKPAKALKAMCARRDAGRAVLRILINRGRFCLAKGRCETRSPEQGWLVTNLAGGRLGRIVTHKVPKSMACDQQLCPRDLKQRQYWVFARKFEGGFTRALKRRWAALRPSGQIARWCGSRKSWWGNNRAELRWQ